VTITAPADPEVSEKTSFEIKADASDPSPGSGVKEVRFYWRYCPGGVCGPENFLAPADTTAPYSATWLLPSCTSMPEDWYRIRVQAEDNCGNLSRDAVKDPVRLIGRGCFWGAARSGTAATWVSELSVAGGRGQVVVDGASAVFPAGGLETFSVPVGPGRHRFEATLVDSSGRPGAWRFDLGALGVVPGSLRVVAGEAAVTASAAVAFRLRGKPGERVVFTVDVAGER
jgi:hypothetical protein